MIRFIFNYLDKILFTLGAILGFQLPAFIQQYSQRIGGHLNESLGQLDKYKLLAAKHHEGSLQRLIDYFESSDSDRLNSVGKLVADLKVRTGDLQVNYDGLQQDNFFERAFYFFRNFDLDVAKATLEHYQWSIPLTFEAVLCALIVATIVTMLFSFLRFLGRKMLDPLSGGYSRHRNRGFDDEDDFYDGYDRPRSQRRKEPVPHETGERKREPSFHNLV